MKINIDTSGIIPSDKPLSEIRANVRQNNKTQYGSLTTSNPLFSTIKLVGVNDPTFGVRYLNHAMKYMGTVNFSSNNQDNNGGGWSGTYEKSHTTAVQRFKLPVEGVSAFGTIKLAINVAYHGVVSIGTGWNKYNGGLNGSFDGDENRHVRANIDAYKKMLGVKGLSEVNSSGVISDPVRTNKKGFPKTVRNSFPDLGCKGYTLATVPNPIAPSMNENKLNTGDCHEVFTCPLTDLTTSWKTIWTWRPFIRNWSGSDFDWIDYYIHFKVRRNGNYIEFHTWSMTKINAGKPRPAQCRFKHSYNLGCKFYG